MHTASYEHDRIIDDIEKVCRESGERLTDLRKEILSLMLKEEKPLKAYEILEKMRDYGKKLTPATIYRVLDFLTEKGFVHRINFLNAFIPCTEDHKKRPSILFVCSVCFKTVEIDDQSIYNILQDHINSIGTIHDKECIEICGMCKDCLEKNGQG
ncbi:MAG: transcriptional repressor [Desulfovibrio sp.]|nr:transcriptional repressor [Desulfovibrio sp.]